MFIIFAISIPFFFATYPDEANTDRTLTMIYDFHEMNGQDETSRYDELTYIATRNNVNQVLSTEFYCNVPLAMNVESWDIHDTVSINGYSAIITESEYRNGRNCWICELEDGTLLNYEIDSGVLVYGEWIATDYYQTIQLEEMQFGSLPPPRVRGEAILLSGIFIELAVIIWLFAGRLRRS